MSTRPWRATTSFPVVRVSFYFDPESVESNLCGTLVRQLAPLQRNGWIDMWDERQIRPGKERDREIDSHLKTDHLLILLVSPDFLVSKTCLYQMEVALQRHARGEATVIPILVRPCFWEQTELRRLQMLPRGHKSLDARPSPKALQALAAELDQVIRSIRQQVFVAYAPGDDHVVERLCRDRVISSVRLWSPEHSQLTADLGQDQQARAMMLEAFIVVLIVSPLTADSEAVRPQMALADDYHRPVVLFWTSGEDGERPHPEAWRAEAVIDARAERYEQACTELMAFVKQRGNTASVSPTQQVESTNRPAPQAEAAQQESTDAASPTPTDLSKEPRNPYKGLRAFESEDADDFFGREALVDELTHTLKSILSQEEKGESPSRLLAVFGASGSGKSSVVMAGLLPYLQHKDMRGSQEWIYLERMRPGTHPLEELEKSLDPQPVLGNFSLHQKLNGDSLRTLHIRARQLAGSSSRKVVLFIDQFEEMLAPAVSEKDRQHFFNLLITAVTEPRGPLLVLLTLRADFYDRLIQQYPELYRLLDAHRVSVLPMEREDLRQVIEGPTHAQGGELSFEGELVGDLLVDVREQRASLPLLQFTLDQLFVHRDGCLLTLQAYRDIGGVKGALRKLADKTYAALPSEKHCELAQYLFTHLIEPGTMQQDMTCRRATWQELELSDSKLTQRLDETMQAFTGAGLLVTDKGVAGARTVEIGHEALIREWPKCVQWIQEDRENLQSQQTLKNHVEQWEKEGKPKGLLYHGPYLTKMKKRVGRIQLSKQEELFLRASTVHQRVHWIRMIALLLVPVIVLGLVLTPLLVLRPSWCPSWLCQAPQVLLPRGGAHDSNLQVTFQTLQSSFKILPVDPSDYTLGTQTPNDAELIFADQSQPYRIIMKIHSLQQERYGLVINQVALLIKQQAQIIPYPLRVIINHPLIYNNNLFRVTYRGQSAGTQLIAIFMAQQQGSVSLLPGETDEISLEVRSMIAVDLHFQVQVTYHVITELVTHTLILPNIFEVVFSDKANWHPYQILDGQLVAVT